MNKKHKITPAEALLVAAELKKGRTLKDIAAEQGRDRNQLSLWMNKLGFRPQKLRAKR